MSTGFPKRQLLIKHTKCTKVDVNCLLKHPPASNQTANYLLNQDLGYTMSVHLMHWKILSLWSRISRILDRHFDEMLSLINILHFVGIQVTEQKIDGPSEDVSLYQTQHGKHSIEAFFNLLTHQIVSQFIRFQCNLLIFQIFQVSTLSTMSRHVLTLPRF